MNLFNKIIFAIFIICLSLETYSQTDVLNVQVDQNPEIPKYGINYRYFNHFFLGLHFNPIFDNQNVENYSLRSPKYFIGWKNILKVNNFIALTADLGITNNRYCIKQNNNKTVPDTLQWDKQRLIQNQLNSGIYLRVNFDKYRGSYMGHYIDLGVIGSWNFNNIHFTKIENQDNTISKLWRYNPDYFEKFNFGPSVKIGIKRYIFSAQYNLSSILKDDSFASDLTPFSFGFEIGLHK